MPESYCTCTCTCSRMLSTMLHVVILMIAIVGADKTCTKEEDISHLVQSLQSCANAITGLQPSSEIQEKCSPDAGLLQKIESISSTLANITQQIAAIEESIADNAVNIAANAANITTNAGNIATNEEAIAKNSVVVCDSSGWTRVAYLDMSHPSGTCPTGFGLYNESGVRACGRQNLDSEL